MSRRRPPGRGRYRRTKIKDRDRSAGRYGRFADGLLFTLREKPLQLLHHTIHKPAHGEVRHARNDVVAAVDGDEYPLRAAARDGGRHHRRDLAEQRVRDHDRDGADNDVSVAAANDDGIFPRRGPVRPRLEHRSRRDAVGPHRRHRGLRHLRPHRLHDLPPDAAALSVYHKYVHSSSTSQLYIFLRQVYNIGNC